jgi:hypothetical protein
LRLELQVRRQYADDHRGKTMSDKKTTDLSTSFGMIAISGPLVLACIPYLAAYKTLSTGALAAVIVGGTLNLCLCAYHGIKIYRSWNKAADPSADQFKPG